MPERILIVDDEPALCHTVVETLNNAGYAATAATSAEQALLYLQDDPGCDLVLSDILMLDGADGLSLLDVIHVNHPGMPVVMLTALNEVEIATNAFRRGAVDFFLKPFELPQLLSVVARALEHGRLTRQNTAYRHNLEEIIAARTSKLRTTMKELERSYDITLEAMGDALDLRDAETEGHSRRVTAYTIALARQVGVTADELKTIARGAFLHDIGKIATPDCILLKPGKLTPEETVIMREHCARGYDMVRKIPFLREAAEIVYAHQEAFDGSGYPRGLRGDEIPLGARIFAIADTLDAMTSDRPYREGMSFTQARDEITRCGGKQFDPRVVEVFLAMPETLWRELRDKVGTGHAGLFDVAA